MAFVFEKERWSQPKTNNYNLGPGTYDYTLLHRKQRLGYISPETKITKPTQTPTFLEQQIIQKTKDEKREGIRLMYLKTKIKHKHKKQAIIEKQNLQFFKGFVKSGLSPQKSDRGKKCKSKKQAIQIMNKQKSIPSLCKVYHQGLCIDNQTRKPSIKSAKLNKINYKQYNQFIYKKQTKNQQQIQNLFVGQFITKNSKQSQRAQCKTAQTKSHHSLKNKIQIVKQLCNAYEQKPTAIQDSQNSIQYIQDSTPGPGSYNLDQNSNQNNKFIGGFGVTVNRFPNQKIIPYKYNLNINIPEFKKTTKASQNEVAFGSSTKDKLNSNQINQYTTYLQDYNSIQHKSLKNLINSYNKGGFFLSKAKRFIEKQQNNYYGPIFYIKQQKNQQYQKYLKKPQSIFLSKVERLYPNNQLTANVDFTGQQFKTIKNVIQKNIQIDRKPSPFLSDAPRFNYSQSYNAIQLNNDLKQQIEKQNIKGFTFNKSQQKQIQKQTTPFGKYQVGKQWVKQSFNIKFQAFDSV